MNTAQAAANNADALDSAQAVESKKLRPCQCGDFADAETGESLQCEATTFRDFAPGHDAKLKGHLIRIGKAGHKVRVLGIARLMTAVDAANLYNFAHMVESGISRVIKPRNAAESETPKVKAKVGRWEYEGKLVNDGALFQYYDKQGDAKSTTRFTLI